MDPQRAMIDLWMSTRVAWTRRISNIGRSGFSLARWALAGAMLVLFVSGMSGESQACQSSNEIIQSEASNNIQSVDQIVAEPSVESVSALVPAALNDTRTSGTEDQYDNICCSCHCCPASPTAISADDIALPFSGNLQRIIIPCSRTHLPSTEPDTLFRPPRWRA